MPSWSRSFPSGLLAGAVVVACVVSSASGLRPLARKRKQTLSRGEKSRAFRWCGSGPYAAWMSGISGPPWSGSAR